MGEILDFAPAEVEVDQHADGVLILRSPQSLQPHERHIGEMLRRWAAECPDTVVFAEPAAEDGWRRVTYAEALRSAESIGQSLLEGGLNSERPLMVLSGNSLRQALLMLGAYLAGVPIAPVSPSPVITITLSSGLASSAPVAIGNVRP